MTGLIDCCMHRYSHDVRMTLHGIEGTDVDADLFTCGHHLNTFSATSSQKTVVTNDAEELLRPSGKRIDFVLYKFVQDRQKNSSVSLSGFNHHCIATKLNCDGKDPQSGLSFSDHQPVSVQLTIKLGPSLEAGDRGSLSKLPLQALMNYKNGTFFSDQKGDDHKNGYKKETNDFHDLSVDEIGVEDVEEMTIGSNSPKEEACERNTLLDMFPGRRSSFTTESKTVSKVHFTEQQLSSKHDDPSWSQLDDCENLLNQYLDGNYSSKQKKQLTVILLMIISLSLTFAAAHVLESSLTTLFNAWSIVIASGFSLLLAIESANRFERTAVKGILEEISCLLSFCPGRDLR